MIAWALAFWGGVAATLLATGLIALAQRAGWTRFQPIRLLGCLVHARPDARGALVSGMILHFAIGSLVLPVAYAGAFELVGRADALAGTGFGGLHGLAAGLALPAFERRTRCARARNLQASGVFARRTGLLTPLGLLVIHGVYGAALGFVYIVPA